MSASDHLGPQFVPAHVLREGFRPEPHELYSGTDSLSAEPRPWFHEDDAENLRLHRQAKLAEAQRLAWENEPEGPDNQSLVDHIRDKGFVQPVLVDHRWRTIVDGNHHLEAAYHLDPNYPVPVEYTR